MNWKEYIVSDQRILLGKTTIKDTRISVELLLELFSSGWSKEQILASYPTINVEAIDAIITELANL